MFLTRGKKWEDILKFDFFIDGAKTYNLERAARTDVKDKFLLGAGLGLRINLDEHFSLKMDWGYPLGDDSTDKNRIQPHLSFIAVY